MLFQEETIKLEFLVISILPCWSCNLIFYTVSEPLTQIEARWLAELLYDASTYEPNFDDCQFAYLRVWSQDRWASFASRLLNLENPYQYSGSYNDIKAVLHK